MKILNEVKKKIASKDMVLLYISSNMCTACDAVYVKLEHLIEEYEELALIKVDIKEVPAISGEYMVFTVPSIIVFKQGKEIHREARFVQFERLQHMVKNYLDS